MNKALRDFQVTSLPIRGNNRLTPAEQIDIYANMYFYRIRDSLKENFPAILKIIGENRFHNLITDYLIKYPPTHFSLRYAGQHLPCFIKRHPLARQYPYLSDLCQFEWLLLKAFDSADSPFITLEDLKTIPPEKWERLKLTLVPSSMMKRFDWPVDEIHQKTMKRQGTSSFKKTTKWIRIGRKDMKVHYRGISSSEFKAFSALTKGKSFGEICALNTKHGKLNESANQMALWLKRWIDDGFLKFF